MYGSLLLTLSFFFFNDTATPEIYTLSLHDALPILARPDAEARQHLHQGGVGLQRLTEAPHEQLVLLVVGQRLGQGDEDRKSTRLNSSHPSISYAVFCLKKKKSKPESVTTKCNEERT